MLALRGRNVAKTFAQNAKILSPTFGRLFAHSPLPRLTRTFSTGSSSLKNTGISFINIDELVKPRTSTGSAAGQANSALAPELPTLREVSKHEGLSGWWVDDKLDGPGLLMYYDSTGAVVNTVEVVGRDGRLSLASKQHTTTLTSTASTIKTNHIKAHQYEFLTEGKSYATLVQEAVFEGELLDGVYKQGTLRYNAHLSATGEFKNNQLYNGTGCLLSPQGTLRIGTVVEGRLEGYGELHFDNGSAVQGVFTHSRFVDTHVVRTSKQGVETLVTFVDGACAKMDYLNPYETALDGKMATVTFEDGRSYTGELSKYFFVSGTNKLLLQYGGIYRGAKVDGERHGPGWQRQIDGSEWEGEFRHNRVFTGAGTFFVESLNTHYEGAFVAGKLHGPGRIMHCNGNTQEGEFSHGRLVIGKVTVLDGTVMTGRWAWVDGLSILVRGRKYFPDGNVQDGTFGTDGHLHEGTITLTNGVVESGKFKNGLLLDGTRAHPGGPTLEGRFVAGSFTQGKLVNSAGDVSEGEFVSGRLTKGKLTIAASGATMEGEWTHKDGLSWLERGKKCFADGTTHEGAFDTDGHISQGTITWANGVVESGKFAAELLVEGKIAYPSGATCEGRFEGDALIEGKIVFAAGDVHEGTFDRDTRQLLTGTCINPSGHVLKMVDGFALRRTFVVMDEIAGLQVAESNVNGRSPSVLPTEEASAGRTVAPTVDVVTPSVEAPQQVSTTTVVTAASSSAPTSTPRSPSTPSTSSTPQPGTVKYNDGSVYEGSLLGGEKEGLGTVTYADGRAHYGMFKHDALFDGEGVVVSRDGSTFEGKVQSGKYHGWGKLTSRDGKVFEGRFDRGMRAFGKLTFPFSGRVLEGEYHNDVFVQGRLTQGDAVWEGTFKKYYPCTGSGVLVYADGVRSGSFVRGELDGQGSVVYTKGGSKVGQFVRGELFKGTHLMENEDGTVVEKKVVRGAYVEDNEYTEEPVPQPHRTQELIDQLVRAPSLNATSTTSSAPATSTAFASAFAASSVSAPLRPPRAHNMYHASTSADTPRPIDPAEFKGSTALQPAVHSGQYRVKFIDGVQSSVEYQDGANYAGGWFEGVMHGKGALIYKSLKCLVGEFQDGRIHNGAGFCRLESGGTYEGLFKEGRVHGKGVYVDEDGFVFDGEVIGDR